MFMQDRGDTLQVWDMPLRLFHWLLVVAIAIAFLSSDEDSPIAAWHMVTGWVTAVLLVFRLIWGFIGNEHSRFVNFIRPSGIMAHVRELVTGQFERTVGHNPLGAFAVHVLLAAIGAVLWTGIQVNAGELGEDIHEGFAYALLGLIGIHVAAVLAMSILTRDNLTRAMVTGRKRASLYPDSRSARAPSVVAILVGGAVIAVTILAILRFDPMALEPRFRTEGSERHGSHYPSLELQISPARG